MRVFNLAISRLKTRSISKKYFLEMPLILHSSWLLIHKEQSMKEKISPIQSWIYTLDGMSLCTNMMMLTVHFENLDEDFPAFDSLQESYERLEKELEKAAEAEKTAHKNNLYDFAKKYREDLNAFKKNPEAQTEYVQKILEMGIENTARIMKHVEEGPDL